MTPEAKVWTGIFVLAALWGAVNFSTNRPSGANPLAKPTPDKPAPVPARIKLILFTAEWCGPCRALHAEMRKPEVQKALERFDLSEREVGPEDGEYGVNGYPTFVAITSAGPVKKVGYQSAAQLIEWLNSLK